MIIFKNRSKRVAAFIKCGSRSETEETSGTAHFLEHLHFKVKFKGIIWFEMFEYFHY